MKRIWSRGLGVTLLCLLGCWTTQQELRPPKPPEEFVLPPSSDPRFRSAPGTRDLNPYPDVKKEKAAPTNPKQAPPRFGSGPAMGGGY
jgi:hypothetical protein